MADFEDPEVFEEKLNEMAVESMDLMDEEDIEEYQEAVEHTREYRDVPKHEPYVKRWLFSNGYGVSVIRKYTSYGFYKGGKFELGVIKGESLEDSGLTYQTPITDDVIGHLKSEEVLEIAKEVKDLEE